MDYTVKKTDNYKILLKPNEFYESDTLESGGYYPSAAVKSYIVDFKYDFNANKKIDLQYNYNVTVELNGICTNQDGEYEEIWERKFTVLDTKNGNISSDRFTINEEVNIDYEYFYNLMLEYEESYGVSLDETLKVKFNMNFPNLNGKEVNDFIELDINLNEVITNAEENYQTVKTNNVSKSLKNEDKTQNIVSSIIIVIVVLYLAFKIYLFKNRTPKDKYKKKVKNVLKYCKDLIVVIKEKPNFDNLKVIKIENLDSLVNLAEQTKSNIIYYEEIKDRKSDFYVIDDNFVYLFEIKLA